MTTTTAFSDVVYKFSTPTNTDTLVTSASSSLTTIDHTGIDFNLQIVEKGNRALASTNYGSSIVGSGPTEIGSDITQALANVITMVFVEKSILTAATDNAGSGRNIRSMKLIVNVDPNA